MRSLPPVKFCLGTSPIQAANSRPDLKIEGSDTEVTSAVAMIGPIPGMISKRRPASFERCQAWMRRSLQSASRSTVVSNATRLSRHVRARGGSRFVRRIGNNSERRPQPRQTNGRHDTKLRQMRAQGVHQHGALTDQERAGAVKHPQVELGQRPPVGFQLAWHLHIWRYLFALNLSGRSALVTRGREHSYRSLTSSEGMDAGITELRHDFVLVFQAKTAYQLTRCQKRQI